MSYQIKLEKFEGPLSLLLELIEKHKLSINEISLVNITDQYIEHLKSLGEFPMAEAANFIAVASTLLLIKSSSLIPNFELSEEEIGDIKNLERRLQLYNLIKNAAAEILKIFGKNIGFSREAYIGCSFEFLEPKGLTREKIFSAMEQIAANLPKEEILPRVLVKKAVSMEKKIAEIVERIQQKIEMSFADAFASKGEKIEIIISFLSILELIKRGFIIVEQPVVFDNIRIKKNY